MNNTIEKLIEELNPEQKEAAKASLDSCTKIVAGAGTGKTKIISKRFAKLTLDLIEKNTDTPTSRILVITFTDKAANEMKERIIKELNANNLNSYEDELWVSTFHGFCNKILRRHAVEINLSPDFELAETSVLYETYSQLIKILKYNEYETISNLDEISQDLQLEKNIIDIKNLQQLAVIDKLDDIFEDIFEVIKKIKSVGLTPKEFLDATLTANKKFSSISSTLPFNLKTKEEYINVWEKHLSEYNEDCSDYETDGIFKDLEKLFVKNGSRKPENWVAQDGFYENIKAFETVENYLTKVIAYIYAIYQNILAEKNLVDFDDLINKTILILKKSPLIRSYYQKFFKHLIIDEFQDTNGAQLELIKLLLNNETPNITFVGDRKQSIYGFRHAQMENLEVLHKYIEEKYSKKYPEIKLSTNYRSDSHVLDLVNYTTLNTLNLNEPLSACKVKDLKTENKFVKNTILLNCSNEYERKTTEIKYIAEEILRLCKENNAKFHDFAILVKSHAQSELVEKILTDANIPSIKKANKTFFSEPVIKNACAILALLKNPSNEIALTRLLKIKNSDNELYKIKQKIDTEYSKLGLIIQGKKLNFAQKIITLFEKNLLNNTELNAIYSQLTKAIQIKQKKNILNLFIFLQQEIPLYQAKTDIEQMKNENNLRIFEKILFDYEQNKTYTNISELLEYIEKVSEDKNFELPNVSSLNKNAVQILTIYASKGLEFPYVFVCGITNRQAKSDEKITFDLQYGKKPGFGLIINKFYDETSPKSIIYKAIWKKPRTKKEEKRVFYVAVSRAEKYLNVLSFDGLKGTNPAEYTKDFPQCVILETTKPEDISTAKNQNYTYKKEATTRIFEPLNIDKIEKPKEIYKFSFSKLNTFSLCSKKFELKYKYGFTPLKSSDGAQIGNIVHKLIYNSFIYQKEFTKEEIIKLLESIKVDYEVKNKIYNLYNSFLTSPYSVKNLQNIETQVEKHFECIYEINDKKVLFFGDIDLLVKNSDNSYSIIDFKTNKDIQKDKENYFKQLFLYKTALESEGLKVKKALLVALGDDGLFSGVSLENEPNVKIKFDSILESAINCEENKTETKKNEKACKFCDLAHICTKFN